MSTVDAHDYNSRRGDAHDAPGSRGPDVLGGRMRRDRRREVDGADRSRSLRGPAALHGARALLRGEQPADARPGPPGAPPPPAACIERFHACEDARERGPPPAWAR